MVVAGPNIDGFNPDIQNELLGQLRCPPVAAAADNGGNDDYTAVTPEDAASASSGPSSAAAMRRRRGQIVFFDLETTMASGDGERPKLLEFGAVVLAAQGLRELQSFSTMVRQPGVTTMASKFNLPPHHVVDLPSFVDVADQVYDMLHGRIWAGHNIIKFDMVCIRDAFAIANRQAPEPAGVIDTLPLLRDTFGPRAGNLKMASLAKYCGLGKQKHRSLADVRMNVEVLKHCATMLFLESHFPSVLPMPRTQPPTRSYTSRLSKAGRGILETPNHSPNWPPPRWENVIQRPKIRTIEMKRVSPIRPIVPTTTTIVPSRKSSRLPQYLKSTRSHPLVIKGLIH